MLTKIDLKQIANVVDERLGVRLEDKFEKKLKPIKKYLRYIKKTVDLIVKNYDEADVKLERRVRKIEQHLTLD